MKSSRSAYILLMSIFHHVVVIYVYILFSFINTILIFLYKYPFSNLTHVPFIILHLVVTLVASP
jgi:hypothetical protein